MVALTFEEEEVAEGMAGEAMVEVATGAGVAMEAMGVVEVATTKVAALGEATATALAEMTLQVHFGPTTNFM